MAINSKLEFFRFELNPKKEDFKTFKDFAIEELGCPTNIKNANVTKPIFEYFIKSLESDYSKDSILKKQITVVQKKKVNKHFDKQPNFDSAKYIIHGVINGGMFGRDRILASIANQNQSSTLGVDKSVLQYFYFLLYIPADHKEGCLIVHSNSSDESITVVMRRFIAKIFRGLHFNKPIFRPFCPQTFQDEFRDGAILKSVVFKNSFIESIHSTDAVKKALSQYDVRIVATPKSKTIPILSATQVKDFFSKKFFGNQKTATALNQFTETKIVAENPVNKSTKIFEWNSREAEFVPVVYLKGRVSTLNADGTPDFDELSALCITYLVDEVIPELRPDLDVTKA